MLLDKLVYSTKAELLLEKLEYYAEFVHEDLKLYDIFLKNKIVYYTIGSHGLVEALTKLAKHPGHATYFYIGTDAEYVFIPEREDIVLDLLKDILKDFKTKADLSTLDKEQWWDNDYMLKKIAKRMGYKLVKN